MAGRRITKQEKNSLSFFLQAKKQVQLQTYGTQEKPENVYYRISTRCQNCYIINITPLLRLLYMVAFFKKDQDYNLRKKRQKILFLLGWYHDKIIININTPFLYGLKLFGLFCIENDFRKYLAKGRNLLYCFKYFVSHTTIISRHDTLLYTTGQIKFP